MEIKTKYNIGDTIKIEDYITEKRICTICNGTGRVTIKESNFSMKCPGSNVSVWNNCHEGKIDYSVASTKDVIIKRITVDMFGDSSKEIRYYYGAYAEEDDGDWFDEKHVKG